MTGDILRKIREARGIGMADVREVSPYMAVVLARIERLGVSYRKEATGNHNARRRRHWRRALEIIRKTMDRREGGLA